MQIRYIKKENDKLLSDTVFETQSGIAELDKPAYITINNDQKGTRMVSFSYTGSTENIVVCPIQEGLDVSVGVNSGRISRVVSESRVNPEIIRQDNVLDIITRKMNNQDDAENIRKGLLLASEVLTK